MKAVIISFLLVCAAACSAGSAPQAAFSYNQAPKIPAGATNGSRCVPYGGVDVPVCIYTLLELVELSSAKSIPVLVEGNLIAHNGRLVLCPDGPANSPVFMLDIQQDLSAQDIAVMIGKRVQIAGFFSASGKQWSPQQQAGKIIVNSLRWL